MKEKQDYIQDIAQIRSMMERSSKFLSLSGWAGIMAGIYALAGAFIAYHFFSFQPEDYDTGNGVDDGFWPLLLVATGVLVLALGTAVWLSYKKAAKNGERIWTPTARQMAESMAGPLVAGGLLCLVLIAKDLLVLVAPCTLIFYGLALFNAGRFTYPAIKTLGLIQMALGLAGAALPGYGLLLWALGFGVFHIIYGIYIHNRYER